MNIPNKCPACASEMHITELACSKCKTLVQGHFELNELARLNGDRLAFLKAFISARGTIKKVEKSLGVSYPTVRAKLDDLIRAMGLPTGGGERGHGTSETLL